MNDKEFEKRLESSLAELARRAPAYDEPVQDKAQDVRRRHKHRVTRHRALAGLAVAAAAVTLFAVYAVISQPPTEGPTSGAASTESSVQIISSTETLVRFPTTTAADWTEYSDFVALVKVTSEQPTQKSGNVLGRTVTAEVQRVLWAQVPETSMPTSLQLVAPGWLEEGGRETELAYDMEPRLETGRTYVAAFVEAPRQCRQGDDPEPARWTTLGPGSVIPIDEDRLGYGESEGVAVSGDADQSADGSLEATLLGKSARELAMRLDAAAEPNSSKQDTFPDASC